MRTAVSSQPRQTVCKAQAQKTLHKKGLVEWLKVKAPKFKPQYCKKQNKITT
jgi:hypothetical protein